MKAINLKGGRRKTPGVLPYMDYTGMCRCEGYGFQALYSGIGYTNQRVCNGNRAEWSPIRSVMIRVMQESDLFNHEYDYRPN